MTAGIMVSTENALKSFFDPRSIAIVGASPIANKVGNIIAHNLIENKRRGLLKAELFPVNPKYPTILGQQCYKSLHDLPQDVETLVIVIPAEGVPGIIEEGASKNAKAAIVISSGFREVGNTELVEETGQGKNRDWYPNNRAKLPGNIRPVFWNGHALPSRSEDAL